LRATFSSIESLALSDALRRADLSRPTIVLAPPDDEGVLFELLLITKADAALIFSTTEVEIERMVDKGHLDVVRLGPRPRDEFIKTETIRRNFGLRVLAMRPVRPFAPGTPAHLRRQPPGRLSPPPSTGRADDKAFVSRREHPHSRAKPTRGADELVHDGAHNEPGTNVGASRETA
jgi:hypothetical protein